MVLDFTIPGCCSFNNKDTNNQRTTTIYSLISLRLNIEKKRKWGYVCMFIVLETDKEKRKT
jgi:hypothetical protein